MLLHDLLFELSHDASVDQVNNPLADPNERQKKKNSTCPNETIIANLHAYSFPLQGHTPAGPRTQVHSFDADIARVAPIFLIPRTEEKTLLPVNLVDHAPRIHLTSIHQVNPAVSHPETRRSRNVLPVHSPLSNPPPADCVVPTNNSPQGADCGSTFCMGCILRYSYAPGPNRCFSPGRQVFDGLFSKI